MDRTISLVAVIPAMIAITPAAAQAVPSTTPAPVVAPAATPPATDLSFADAPKPHSVRIAGKTVALDSLPASGDASPAAAGDAAKAKPKARAHR